MTIRIMTALACLTLTLVSLASTNIIVDVNWRDNPEMRKKILKSREKYRGKSPQEIVEMRTGGLIKQEGTGEGEIVFVNAQTNLPRHEVMEFVNKISILFHFQMSVVDGEKPSVTSANAMARATGGKIVVFLTDDKTLPRSLVAYEDKWGIVNFGNLEDVAILLKYERMKKMLFRTFALVAGLADAPQIGSTMWPIASDKDLDGVWLPNVPLPNLANALTKHLERLGMKQTTVKTYRRACEEGWAPAPTNDVQKAIWDKVHAMPTAPLKIKPETKKVAQ